MIEHQKALGFEPYVFDEQNLVEDLRKFLELLWNTIKSTFEYIATIKNT